MSSVPDPGKGVSITPSSFVPVDILGMPAEEVIRTLFLAESRRSPEDKDLNQRAVRVFHRGVPNGLTAALSSVALETGMDAAVVTRCLSHKLKAWYDNIPFLGELQKHYAAVHSAAAHDGYPDLVRRLDSAAAFEMVSLYPTREPIQSVAYIVAALDAYAPVLGVSTQRLLVVGLCYALTTNTQGWCPAIVDKYLRPEVVNLSRYVNERLLILRHLDDVLEFRRGWVVKDGWA